MFSSLHSEKIIRDLFWYRCTTNCDICQCYWSHFLWYRVNSLVWLLPLKITNKCALSSRHVIVAELHETGCSTGCLFVLFQAGLFLSSPLCASDCSATWHERTIESFWKCVCVCFCLVRSLGVCVCMFVCLPGNSKTKQGWDKQKC